MQAILRTWSYVTDTKSWGWSTSRKVTNWLLFSKICETDHIWPAPHKKMWGDVSQFSERRLRPNMASLSSHFPFILNFSQLFALSDRTNFELTHFRRWYLRTLLRSRRDIASSRIASLLENDESHHIVNGLGQLKRRHYPDNSSSWTSDCGPHCRDARLLFVCWVVWCDFLPAIVELGLKNRFPLFVCFVDPLVRTGENRLDFGLADPSLSVPRVYVSFTGCGISHSILIQCWSVSSKLIWSAINMKICNPDEDIWIICLIIFPRQRQVSIFLGRWDAAFRSAGINLNQMIARFIWSISENCQKWKYMPGASSRISWWTMMFHRS
jgi:hypothetical protein